MRVLASTVLVVLLAACTPGSGSDAGGSPSDGATAADESAIRDGLAVAFAGDRPGPDAEAKGECFAEALLSATTTEELRAAGILDGELAVVAEFPELERPLAEKVVDAQLACTDFVADSSRAGSYVTKGRLVQRRYARCLRRDLSENTVRAALLAAVMGEWEADAVDRLSTVQVDCANRAER